MPDVVSNQRTVVVIDAMGSIGGRKQVLKALGEEAVVEVLLRRSGSSDIVDVETATRTIRSAGFRWGGTGSGVVELATFFQAIGWPYDETFLARLGDHSFKITSLSSHQVV